MKPHRWATLGCGVIAHELAQAMAERGQTLYAVANRTHDKAHSTAFQTYTIKSKMYLPIPM